MATTTSGYVYNMAYSKHWKELKIKLNSSILDTVKDLKYEFMTPVQVMCNIFSVLTQLLSRYIVLSHHLPCSVPPIYLSIGITYCDRVEHVDN